MNPLTCIAIDDDVLFLKSLQAYLSKIALIDLKQTFTNPVQGAKGILQIKPDLIFTDYEMPLVDGDYLIDWIKPNIDRMDKRPVIILVSAVDRPPQTLLDNVDWFIRKREVRDAASLENQLRTLIK
ncbi:response regulator [Marinoscillum sp.]|uniref:response regulator n=1 Tax=Marinoscillum sp. TaxID=2024838 RepID=UPI003BAC4215